MNRSRWTPTSTFKPMVPDVPQVKSALERSETLASLMQRLRASQECLAAVKTCLPPAMAAHVKAGPIDEEGWTLLAANAAVSAKLRQLQPRIAAALAAKGIKVYKTFVGEYMTSLEMEGFSGSLLRLDDELKALLDAPADTIAFKA